MVFFMCEMGFWDKLKKFGRDFVTGFKIPFQVVGNALGLRKGKIDGLEKLGLNGGQRQKIEDFTNKIGSGIGGKIGEAIPVLGDVSNLWKKGEQLVGGAADVANQIRTGNYSGAVNSGIQILKGGRKLVDDTRNLGQQAMDQAATAVDNAHRQLKDKVGQFKAAAKAL